MSSGFGAYLPFNKQWLSGGIPWVRKVYTSPEVVGTVVGSPAVFTPSTPAPLPGIEQPGSTTTVVSPATVTTPLVPPQTPTKTGAPGPDPSQASPVNSHISSSHSTIEETGDHDPTPPLTFDKVSSPTATPKMASPNVTKAAAQVKDDGSGVNYPQGVHSPVVEDTLSDIDDAITEISGSKESRTSQVMKDHNRRHSSVSNTRPSFTPVEQVVQDSSSEYSKHDNESDSEIEDDDPEDANLPNSSELFYTEEQIKAWTPVEVAKYLESRNIPLASCQKFEEQEVSGSILLQLEMSHLKELELGSFGKRFEVWKEIENLVKRSKRSPPKTKPRSGSDARLSAVGISQTSPRQRSSTVGGGPVLPMIPSHHNRPVSKQHHINTHEANMLDPRNYSYAPLHTPMTATTIASGTGANTPPGIFEAPRSPPVSPRRSDTASQRRRTVSGRRLSAHELSPTALNVALSASAAILTAGIDGKGHQRISSFDRDWSSSALTQTLSSTGDEIGEFWHKTSTSVGTGDTGFTGDSGFSGSQPQTPGVMERSYFSSGESTPRERKVLQKRSGAHARQSRIGSAEIPGRLAPICTAAQAYHIRGNSKEKQNKRKSTSFSGPPEGFPYDSPGLSPSSSGKVPPRKTIDDPIITNTNIPTAVVPTRSASETLKKADSGLGSGDGSTPSLTATLESDTVSGPPERPPKADRTQSTPGRRIRGVSSGTALRQKSKKHHTSAWEKGLREITPQEAAETADFSGWMKKRGSSGLGVWKPRFFVLQGRRLAYFYADTDTKERGLIDITSHRVLSATDDRFVSLHAQFAASPTSPNPPPLEKRERGADKDKGKEKEEKERGWFTFKLVPPAPGASKGVTFTPPRLHYFATDTREEGKKWMGAIMKATIDRDESKPIVSSYNAKTISLAKARQLKSRPPELAMGDDGNGMDFGLDRNNRPESSTSGLAITGIEFGDGGEEADVEDGRDGSMEIAGNGEAESSHDGGGEREREESLENGRESVKVEVVFGETEEERERKELLTLVGDIGIITR
ncbi:hypothetical protein C7212DRAFT_358509 [Tuber magnatum]|uniref:PH domain-containing protein n=1 Tax=Tuber magnatum TaxID=42249 RepID=A0A317SQD0_9PEZI|nr:hypothetical protein C7212DRAFT_358509 [Tuber magnatum]